MTILNSISDPKLVQALAAGQLAVMKSDTIYGIFASALSLDAYQNLIAVRPKSSGKHYIILISGREDAIKLGISEDDFDRIALLWPAPITLILKSNNPAFKHLANSDGQLGVRIPADKNLRKLLRLSGPLLAPSANPEGQIPASNIYQAQEYFGDRVQLYFDSGEVPTDQPPSTVIGFIDGQLSLIRSGAFSFQTIKDKLKLKEPYKRRKLHKFSLFAGSKICFEAEQFKFSDVAQNFQKVNLEIGAGTAELSLSLAESYPDQLFIAIDVKADRLVQGALKAERRGLKNLIFLRANINTLLNLMPEKAIDQIWITFPDPMPKLRQAKHRLLGSHFLEIYRQILTPGGEVLFKTDDQPLFLWSLEQIVEASGRLLNLSFDLHGSNMPDQYKIATTYEAKFKAEGKAINFVRFKL